LTKRILFIQNGDYREAVRHFAAGGGETYYAQRYSVDFVADLLKREDVESVGVVCIRAEPPYSIETLENGVQAVGVHVDRGGDDAILTAVRAFDPTHIILRTPRPRILRYAIDRHLPTQCVLADSFESGGWRGFRGRWRNRQLARLLNDDHFAWIGNHSVNASRSLARIGVKPEKIIPWDWPPQVTPGMFKPKSIQPGCENRPITLFFAGVISVAKGVTDCLEAVAILREKGVQVRFDIAGNVRDEEVRAFVRDHDLANHVTFLGRIEHRDVLRRMHEADAVLVPSRHEYPEGLPMTIYDGLCSRTPLIVSDHPMFRGKIEHGVSGMVFRASEPRDLAKQVERLMSDADLYASISRNAAQAWEGLQLPVTWGELITRFLDGVEGNRAWAAEMCLAGSGSA